MKIKLLFNNFTTRQTIIKNTFWLILSEAVSKIPVFLLNILIIRYLGAKDYGKFSFIFAFSALLAVIVDFGLSTLTIREVAKNRKLAKKYLNNLPTLKLLLSLISLVVVFLLVLFTGQSWEFRILILLATVFVMISSLTTFFQSVFQAFEKMEYLFVSKLVYSVALAAMMLYVIQLNLGVKMLMTGYVLAATASLLAVVVLVKRKVAELFLKIDLVFWKKTLVEAWPFALIALLGTAYMQMNTIQLRFLAGEIETGLYNTAFQFIMVIITLVGVFFGALFPALSKEWGKSKLGFYKLIDFFAKRVMLGMLGLCLVLFLISDKLFLWLYGVDYLGSINIFRCLLISISILFINTTYAQALKIMKLQKDYLRAMGGGVMLNFLLNFLLIPWLGGLGASLTTVFSSLLITVLIVLKFKQYRRMDLAK